MRREILTLKINNMERDTYSYFRRKNMERDTHTGEKEYGERYSYFRERICREILTLEIDTHTAEEWSARVSKMLDLSVENVGFVCSQDKVFASA